MKETILITGGAGFIGSQLATHLLKLKYRVVIVDNLSTGLAENLPVGAVFYQADLLNFSEIKRIVELEKPSFISHHAAQAQVRFSISHPQIDATTNVIGLINLLEAVKTLPQIHLIFASSGGAIYDGQHHQPSTEKSLAKPASQYGVSKLAAESYLSTYQQLYPNLKVTVLRYANVYGPHQNPNGEAGVTAIFIQQLLRGITPNIFGEGTHVRDYVFVTDVVAANLAVIQQRVEGTFNIGTGQEISTLQVYQTIAQELAYPHPAQHVAPQLGEQPYNCLDSTLAWKKLKWKATTDFVSGIRQTVAWQKSLNSQNQSAPTPATEQIKSLFSSVTKWWKQIKFIQQEIFNYLVLNVVYFVGIGITAIFAKFMGKQFLKSSYLKQHSSWEMAGTTQTVESEHMY